MKAYLTSFVLISFNFVTHLTAAQTPMELAKLICDQYTYHQNFDLPFKYNTPLQEGILPIYLKPEKDKTYIIETFLRIGQEGENYLAMSGNPGSIKLFVGDELIFDGKTSLATSPTPVDYGLFEFEYRSKNPIRKGPHQIKIQFTPSGFTNSLFLWVIDDKGMVQKDIDFKMSESETKKENTYRFNTLNKKGKPERDTWSIPPQFKVRAHKSPLDVNDWRYFTGINLDAIRQISMYFDSLDYTQYLNNHLKFFSEKIPMVEKQRNSKRLIKTPFSHYYRYQLFDDFGPQTVPFLYSKDTLVKKPFVDKALNEIKANALRHTDGTFVRYTPDSTTIWADDLFMSTIFLSRTYELTNDEYSLQEAVKQVKLFHQYLKDDETNVYWHGYFLKSNTHSSSRWARANGWTMMAKLELLKVIPEDHPDRSIILEIFQQHAEGLLQVQSTEGRWHQVLNNRDTYLETSATAMFVRAFAEGILNGWLDKDKYFQATKIGWEAILAQSDFKGNVKGIVKGTPILFSDEAYNQQKVRTNDPRGLGAVLYACIAIDRLFNETADD